MQTKLDLLIKAVDKEFKKAERAYKLAKKSAEEIAASATSSMSQAGDRFHSQGTADLAKQRFETISALKKEVESKRDKINVKYQNEDLFLVDNPTLINGFKLVSTKSPLGVKLTKN